MNERLDAAKRKWLEPWDAHRGVQQWDHNYAATFVDASPDAVGAALQARGGKRWDHDVLDREIVVEPGIFVFRLRGHRWTTAVATRYDFLNHLGRDRELSTALSARVLSWMISDTGGELHYSLFAGGRPEENFRVSEDELIEFTSADDIESPEDPDEFHRFAERRLIALDLYEPGLSADYFFGGRPTPGARVAIRNPGLECQFPDSWTPLRSTPAFERVDFVADR